MIEYNDTLNPKLWENNLLKQDVKEKLIKIYDTFISKLKENKIPIDVIDVQLLGSNAAYNYTDSSDIDLHVIVDFDDIPLDSNVTQIFYNNEKSKFNEDYDIMIKGLPVELYIEDINAGNMSDGIYSLLQDKWIKFPEYNPPQEVDYTKLLDIYTIKINDAINSNESEKIKNMINEIKMLRKTSLMNNGIYSKGNLVFKDLRNNGMIQQLYDKYHELVSQELSLESKQINESSNIISLINKLNSLDVAYPNTSRNRPFANYELISNYENILNQFPIGTTMTHKMEAGTEKFNKISDLTWEHTRMPWKKTEECSVFDIARWLANRGNISRGNIELSNTKQITESGDNKRIDLFEFTWNEGSINDNIIKYFKEHNKPWRYRYFQLETKINGKWYATKSDIEKLGGLVKVYCEIENDNLNEYICPQCKYNDPSKDIDSTNCPNCDAPYKIELKHILSPGSQYVLFKNHNTGLLGLGDYTKLRTKPSSNTADIIHVTKDYYDELCKHYKLIKNDVPTYANAGAINYDDLSSKDKTLIGI